MQYTYSHYKEHRTNKKPAQMLGEWQPTAVEKLSFRYKGAHESKAQKARAYPGFPSMKHAEEYYHRPLWTGCQSIVGLPPSSMSPVPIYTPG